MSTELITILQNYDAGGMEKWQEGENDKCRLFLNANGMLLKQQTENLKTMVDNRLHANDPSQNFFQLLVESERKANISKEIFTAIERGNIFSDCSSYFQGEYYFNIGYCLTQIKDHNLALEYLSRSRELFLDAKLEAFVWRSDFNIYLCLRRLKRTDSLSPIEQNLKKDFVNLPELAQIHFSRFFIWLLIDTKNLRRAKSTCLHFLHLAEKIGAPEYLKDNLRTTESYLIYKLKTEKSSRSTRRSCFHEPLSRLDRALADKPSKKEISSLFEQISSEFEGLELAMMLDIHLEILLAQADYELVRHALILSRKLLVDDVLTICPVDEHEIVACLKFGNSQKGRRLLKHYANHSTPKRFEKLQDAVSKLENEMSRFQIYISREEKQVRFKDRSLDFRKRSKMFELFLLLAERKTETEQSLARAIYSSNSSQSLHKLRSVMSRLQGEFSDIGLIEKKLGCFQISSPEYKFYYTRGGQRKKRLNQIVNVVEKSENIGISLLEKKFPHVARRTLQADLNYLVKNQRIKSTGTGRGTQYSS